MIRKYRFGTPFETDAVVQKLPEEAGALPYFTTGTTADGHPQFTYRMAPEEVVYGLGEQVRGINKRGWIYEGHAVDNPYHYETRTSLYAGHNFILVFGGAQPFGLFVDDPADVTFDVGYTNKDELVISLANDDADLYLLDGASPKELAREFRRLIGRSYIPPKWAFGYGQSRWKYATNEDFYEIQRKFRENHIPIDSIYMDIDYMVHYKDFTVNTENIDLPTLSADLKADGIRLVPIIDAGVKQEEGYWVCDEGVEKGYFCTKEDGSNFVGAVWPGQAYFPDVLRPEVRDWFGHQYQTLIDQGIEGFWNDMCEPAIFYTPEQLSGAIDQIAEYRGTTSLELEDYNDFQRIIQSAFDAEAAYDTFYHTVDGKRIKHRDVHNLYGFNMTRAASEAFDDIVPDKRLLLFSRSSYIGSHRYGGIWTGDNHAWWRHILLSMQQMVGLNLCGYLYAGSDIGGFGDNTTEDLLMRWIEFGVFTPLMRNHNCAKRAQEPYEFTNTKAFADIIGIRYGLLPYLYSEYMKAALEDEAYFRPLALEYPNDPHAVEVEDQLMVGEGMMIAPVYMQNANGRYVYLPEPMKLVRMRSMNDFDTEELPAGHHYVSCKLKELLFFIRPGHVIPCCDVAECTAKLDEQHLSVLSFGDGSYTLYQDDGFAKDYENPAHFVILTVKDHQVSADSDTLSVQMKD